jgi:hypothetical protein
MFDAPSGTFKMALLVRLICLRADFKQYIWGSILIPGLIRTRNMSTDLLLCMHTQILSRIDEKGL